MKKFAFVSDFDGTLSARDFYRIIMDKYMGSQGKEFYTEWKKTKKINVEFLNRIFSSINLSEEQLSDEIKKIPMDIHAADFIGKVRENQGDFYIVSAGTSYYIEILLGYLGIKDVQVISMEGAYWEGGIKITPNPLSPYYSHVFGMDKGKVVEGLRKEYEHIFFAGDSEPDLEAAKAADIVYARGELEELLQAEGVPFTPFSDFSGIKKDLTEKGWLK